MTDPTLLEPARPADLPAGSPGRAPRSGPRRRTSSLLAMGEPMVWLMGGALALCLLMVLSLLGHVGYEGARTFWPGALERFETSRGPFLGEVTKVEDYTPEGATEPVTRWLVRTGNFDISGTHFEWVEAPEVTARSRPDWAVLVERESWGRFYGEPVALEVRGAGQRTEGAAEVWAKLQEHLPVVHERLERIHELERDGLGRINTRLNDARLAVRQAELDHGAESPQVAEARAYAAQLEPEVERESQRINDEIRELRSVNADYHVVMRASDGSEHELPLAEVVRVVPSNQLDFGAKVSVYLDRWGEFLTAAPREANSEGGIWPALFGTVVMTMIMSLLVVPFGVLAALYLREYAKQGMLVSFVRIAVNNLAGVPSIVFGVFGLGFFCYIVGASIDQVFFEASLPNPTYGKGGIMWASLTLALLTLPVVIVATEEALSAVPNSMREGSYACGATKWQTIRRIILPRAMPGIMTGMILAVARGAGEVAPLMLVGAVKLAPDLPIDGAFPFVHPERSFMHLGFHIYDVGFQSQNSEAAKPMVYTTTLLLIGIVITLNLLAIWIRARLRRRFRSAR
ncbi:MAG: phosphate ABC transporter permease PstA [Planctomycetota bacterium]